MVAPPSGGRLLCRCCGATLLRRPRHGLERALAFMSAALILFATANFFPLVTLRVGGLVEETTLLGASWALWHHGMESVGALVFLVTFAVPLGLMLGVIHVVGGALRGRPLPGTRRVLAVLSHLHPWEMGDVFLVSVLVALVKLTGVAEVIVDAGLYLFAGAVVAAVAARVNFDPRLLWAWLMPLEHTR